MLLGAPGALWGLVLIPLVVLLYMLRARRVEHIVPSTLLWERARRDLVARLPVRHLERSVLLLIQILAIALVVVALARPTISVPALSGDAVVLVIDTTASMQATDVAPSRLAEAQRQALVLLRGLGPRQPAALVAAGARPRLLSDLTTDHAALAAAVAHLRATDAGGSPEAAVALAASLRHDGRPARIHVFSDRRPGDARARWHRVGAGAPNAGITSVHARRDPLGRTQVLVRVEAFGAAGLPRTLTVTVGGRAVASRQIVPAPDRPITTVFALGQVTGIAEVTLGGGDALPADDRAVVGVGGEGLPTLMVVGEENAVLDAALAAVPAAEVARTDRVAPDQWGRADVVVLDGTPARTLPPGAYLLINTLGENLPVRSEGTAPAQAIRVVSGTHPVTRLTDLRGVQVDGAAVLRPQAGLVLAEGDGPLVWVYEGRGIRAVVLPFPLERSDLPLHPAFPILIANAVQWLAGERAVHPGAAPAVSAGRGPDAVLEAPDGTRLALRRREGVLVLPPLERVGVYRLRTDGWSRLWLVPTVDARESDLTVEPDPVLEAAAAPAGPAHLPLMPWLLGLAAALMTGEWLLWARTVPRRRR